MRPTEWSCVDERTRLHGFYFNRDVPLQEVFYLTYTPDDVEGSIQLETGDKVSFYMDTNKQ